MLEDIDAFYGDSHVLHRMSLRLGEGHGDLHAAALAVRRLGKGALGEGAEPDPREHLAGTGQQCRLPVESHKGVPAERSEPQQ